MKAILFSILFLFAAAISKAQTNTQHSPDKHSSSKHSAQHAQKHKKHNKKKHKKHHKSKNSRETTFVAREQIIAWS
jgi:Ni/Co efflux regulator RcnB